MPPCWACTGITQDCWDVIHIYTHYTQTIFPLPCLNQGMASPPTGTHLLSVWLAAFFKATSKVSRCLQGVREVRKKSGPEASWQDSNWTANKTPPGSKSVRLAAQTSQDGPVVDQKVVDQACALLSCGMTAPSLPSLGDRQGR